ncbi:MAG: hypothetical protein GY778_14350, partial [bacterium]|nr:hypothetical protein [bacterium]
MNSRKLLLSALGLTALIVIGVAGALARSDASSGPPIPADPATVYDPVAAGEPLPSGYRPLLDRDQIAPVYNPEFTSADGVDWPPDMLVIGVAGSRTAKAYP